MEYEHNYNNDMMVYMLHRQINMQIVQISPKSNPCICISTVYSPTEGTSAITYNTLTFYIIILSDYNSAYYIIHMTVLDHS